MKRLLLIDDDVFLLRAYRDRLSAHGFHVNTAAGGMAALNILNAGQPDLIVLDLMMPDMSGVEVLKFIRSQKRLAATPVILLTNAYLNELGREAAAIGVDRALLKSQCSPTVLMAVVDEILEPKPTDEQAPDDTTAHAADAPDASTEPPHSAAAEPPAQPAASPAQEPAPMPAPAPPPAPEPSAAPDAADATAADLTADVTEASTTNTLLANGPAFCTQIRKGFQAVSRETGNPEDRRPRLRDLYRKVHVLAAAATQAEFAELAQTAAVFEALLYVLVENPARLGASSMRTLAILVDFVELLFQRSRDFQPGPRPPAHVLAVDDDPLANRLVISALRGARLEARSTEDPQLAWQWIQEQPFDLILLDIEMPGLSGIELCKRLRLLPGYEKTPVILVTVHDDFESRARGTLSGANDLITKPILPIELAAKVVMHLIKAQMAA